MLAGWLRTLKITTTDTAEFGFVPERFIAKSTIFILLPRQRPRPMQRYMGVHATLSYFLELNTLYKLFRACADVEG